MGKSIRRVLQDFKSACPIHVIEMKLASVKESPKSKLQLQLVTHYATYTYARHTIRHSSDLSIFCCCFDSLVYESAEECSAWKEAFEEAIAEGLGDDSVRNMFSKYFLLF